MTGSVSLREPRAPALSPGRGDAEITGRLAGLVDHSVVCRCSAMRARRVQRLAEERLARWDGRMAGGYSRYMAGSGRTYKVGEVFVPGGMPTVTYNPREDLHLEQQVRDYLDERHKILSLTGPTKTGKTVLLKNLLNDPLWLSGGSIQSLDDFWMTLADMLRVHTDEAISRTDNQTEGRSWEGKANVGVAAGSGGRSESAGQSQTDTWTRSRALPNATRQALGSNLFPLIIDDFHYIRPDVQLLIIRNLKEAIFDGLPVILAAVPHRAYDAVRVEKEMTGRVEQLQIPFWERDELLGIAEAGFAALNVSDPGGRLAQRLAAESFSSPHLMQEHCRELCKANSVRSTIARQQSLRARDWNEFFTARASAGSKSAFDLLARGPRQRADRKPRKLKNGRTVDIYGAVLAAISKTGPLTRLSYMELRAALRDVMASDAPQRHEVTRVLEEMGKIAQQQIEGEPVIDYDAEMSTLHISDPFFAYFLRWGTHEVGET